MANPAESAVGAILHIDDSLLEKIDKAETKIKGLAKASEEAANAVSKHWGTTAIQGFDTFIEKIGTVKEAIKGLAGGKFELNISTTQAAQNVNKASNQIKGDLQAISDTVQRIAQSFDFSNVEQSVKSLINTFGQVESTIRNTNKVRREFATDDPEVDRYNRLIEVLKAYLAEKKKSNESIGAEQARAEAKAIAAGEKLIAQKEAQIARESKAAEKAAQDYEKWWLSALSKVEAEQAKTDAVRSAQRQAQAAQDAKRIADAQAQAEREVNDILSKRIELQQRITALNTKQSIAALSDPSAKLGFSDTTNLAKYERQMSELEARIKSIGALYPKLARDSDSAFNTQKADMLATSLQKVAEAQTSIANAKSSQRASDAESRLNELYERRLKLLRDEKTLEDKRDLNQAKGLAITLTAKENQLLAETKTKLADNKQQIDAIANVYAGLERKIKMAFDDKNLRQQIELTNRFNAALDAIDTSKTKQLVAEYKKLYAENEKIQKSLDAANKLGAGTMTPQVYQTYNKLFAEQTANFTRMAEIERKNIQEIADFRRQKDMESSQLSISEFVQAEAQKTAAAKKAAEQQSNDRIQAYQKFLNTYQGAMAAANKLGTRGGQWEDTYENRARVIKNLEAAIKSLNKADSDYEKKLKDLTDALKRLQEAQKGVNDAMKQAPKQVTLADARQAVKIAEQTRTLKDYEAAYKMLLAVMRETPQGRAWDVMNSKAKELKGNIDEIKKAMGELRSESSKTSSLMGGLKDKIAAAFSVAAVQGFIKKMVEVRAQFELQRVALGAIIQDRDEANKIFTQVQNMALESPFSIMQLEKATKQIAAFGFETQKLVPTMKMFADISAGLGVEIDRLVLVMGHLKARNFLEGTMVRQFTNMGFNVLGNLAKYYSEIEDRLVSVGEVQERVKKKMISFEDVEEVLKRVTSAGGMFYDMQKKQSDSLWGQMQRIQDAYDLMLNSIGQSNEGVIKSALSAIRSLINHWRILAPIIKDLGYAMAAVFAARGVTMLLSGFTALGGVLLKIPTYLKSIVAGIKAMNLAWSTTGLGALVAIGLTAWEVFRGIRAESEKLNDEFRRIGEDMTNSLNESISTFAQLTKTINDPSSTYTERAEAMTEMRRVYADILPQEKLEIEYIRSLNGDYTELTKTIQEYYQQKEYQQKMEALQASDQAVALTKQWNETLQEMNERGLFDLKYSKSQIKSWADTLSKEMMSGKLHASVEALDKRIKEVFDAKDLSKFWDDIGSTADIQDVLQAYQKLVDAEGDITIETANAENALASYSKQIERLDITQLEKAKETLQAQADTLEKQIAHHEASAKGLGLDPESQKEVQARVEQLQSVRREMEALEKAQAKWLSSKFSQEVESRTKSLTDQVRAFWTAKNAMEKLEMQGKSNTKEWEKQKYAMEKAKESADEVADTFVTTVDWALIKADKTTFELNGHLDDLAANAFPKVAQMAAQSMDGLVKYLLQGKEKTLGWLKDVMELVPEKVRAAIPGFASLLGAVDEKLALTQEELDNVGRAADSAGASAEKAGDRISEIVSAQAIKHVDDFGANISDIDNIIKDNTKGVSDMAKELRGSADRWEKDVERFNTAPDKEVFLEVNNLTKEQIDLFDKNAKAARALAADIDGVSKKDKGTKGKDEIAERWKNRLKAIQDFYKRYEELRQHFDETESLQRATDAFKGLFKVLDINMEDVISKGMGKQGLADNIKSMLDVVRLIRPKLADEFEKAFADVQIQVDFKVREDAEKEVQSQIDGMFDNYELTKELKGLGVPVDLTFMLGGRPMDLDKLKKELQDDFESIGGKTAPQNIVKMYENSFKKIADLENKQRQQQLKNYVKYLTESMGERAQIEIKAIQDVNKIENDAQLDAFSKQQAVMQRRKKMQEELTKFDLDELKSSDVYISVFKDLETASKEQLQYVIDKLKETQKAFSDLSPAQVKSIAGDLKKLESALASKDSVKSLFTNLKSSVEYAKKRNELLREQTKTQDEVNDSAKQLSDEQVRLADLQLKLKSIQDESSQEWQDANAEVEAQQRLVKELQDKIAELEEKLKKVTGQIEQGESAWEGWRKGVNEIRSGMNQVKSSLDAVFSGLDSMGLVNDAFRDTYESITDIIGGLDTFMDGIGSIDVAKPFSVLTGGIKALGGVFQSIGGVFGIGDKKKERQIKKLTEKVETLDKAYQKLEKSIEAAYTFDDYNAGYKQMQQNLDAQKTAYEEMIRLEESKKKTDKEKVKQYEDALEEIAEKQKELQNSLIEDFGSTTDYRSAAEDFVSAWLDAFKETGDGLDALNENWQEFIQNLFIKQAAMAKAGDVYKDVIDIINNAMTKGKTDFSLKEAIAQAQEAANKSNEYMNDYLKALAEVFNIRPSASGELILSDLQKGIQNITEPQAAAIEAYLNSMRFAVFRHTEQLDTLIAAIQTQYGSGAENPVVTELKGIRGVLDSIDRRLGSVIKSNAGKTYVQVG